MLYVANEWTTSNTKKGVYFCRGQNIADELIHIFKILLKSVYLITKERKMAMITQDNYYRCLLANIWGYSEEFLKDMTDEECEEEYEIIAPADLANSYN